MSADPVVVHPLVSRPYETSWQAMKEFTDRRQADTKDEVWLIEHPPVFTLGQAADASHVLDAGTIPIVETDRGGQVTYHGPGQLVMYVLIDIKRAELGIKKFVAGLEQVVIDFLSARRHRKRAKAASARRLCGWSKDCGARIAGPQGLHLSRYVA